MDERGIEPHVRVFDKSERTDGTFSRGDFAFDAERDLCLSCGSRARDHGVASGPHFCERSLGSLCFI